MEKVDQDRLQQEIARGQRVAGLLADEDLQWCLAQVQDELTEVMRHGNAIEVREQARHLYLASEMLVGKMQGTVNRGKKATSVLERLKAEAKTKVERIRRFATG